MCFEGIMLETQTLGRRTGRNSSTTNNVNNAVTTTRNSNSNSNRNSNHHANTQTSNRNPVGGLGVSRRNLKGSHALGGESVDRKL